jgi:hypothetical protein
MWCDAMLETRADLERHVAEQHTLSRGKMKF